VERFASGVMKIPHMGWNEVEFTSDSPLQSGIENREFFYFAHSFYCPVTEETDGTTSCGIPFAAMVQKENYFGIQFHPEKSGKAGLQLLKNFESICKSYRR
jgi:glutamine amidotransferase